MRVGTVCVKMWRSHEDVQILTLWLRSIIQFFFKLKCQWDGEKSLHHRRRVKGKEEVDWNCLLMTLPNKDIFILADLHLLKWILKYFIFQVFYFPPQWQKGGLGLVSLSIRARTAERKHNKRSESSWDGIQRFTAKNGLIDICGRPTAPLVVSYSWLGSSEPSGLTAGSDSFQKSWWVTF